MNCLRSFTLRYALWSLLNLDVLLVREDALVVDYLIRIAGMAVLAEGWLLDSSHLHDSLFFTSTFHAFKLSLLHFRHNVTVANDDSSESDQLVNVFRTHLSDPVDLPEIVWSHLDDGT